MDLYDRTYGELRERRNAKREKWYLETKESVMRRYRKSPEALKAWYIARKASSESSALPVSVFCALIVNIAWQTLAVPLITSDMPAGLTAEEALGGKIMLIFVSIAILIASCLVVAGIAKVKRDDRAYIMLVELIMYELGYLKR